VPSTQSLSNRSLASDQLISGAEGAPRSCPAGSIAEVGLCAARRRRSSQCASGRFASNLGTITPTGCYVERPRMSYCRDHSAGRSVRRATPIP
jgi:hypothetical protein